MKMPTKNISRRDFMQKTAVASAGAALSAPLAHAIPAKQPIPRWRGFNLINFFTQNSDLNPKEEHFKWMTDWGFDFARIPLDYRIWTDEKDIFKLREDRLALIDKVIEYGQKYNIHVNINFHRGPGYCVNRPELEPFNLWKDPKALEAFLYHWDTFAKRYKEVSKDKLSFNLINEPRAPKEDFMTREDCLRVMREAIKTVRSHCPDRIIFLDGVSWGKDALTELNGPNIVHSTRGYQPFPLTHYKASWVNSKDFPEPSWPIVEGKSSNLYDRKKLETLYEPWVKIARDGVAIHCGEFGVYNKTPHKVALAWMEDLLDVLKERNIGFALWNLNGAFGILDSGRTDMQYADWHGHKLDKEMLALLRKY